MLEFQLVLVQTGLIELSIYTTILFRGQVLLRRRMRILFLYHIGDICCDIWFVCNSCGCCGCMEEGVHRWLPCRLSIRFVCQGSNYFHMMEAVVVMLVVILFAVF